MRKGSHVRTAKESSRSELPSRDKPECQFYLDLVAVYALFMMSLLAGNLLMKNHAPG